VNAGLTWTVLILATAFLRFGLALTLQASQSCSAFLNRTVSSFCVFTSSFKRLSAYNEQLVSLYFAVLPNIFQLS
jgi:hypothetical protein